MQIFFQTLEAGLGPKKWTPTLKGAWQRVLALLLTPIQDELIKIQEAKKKADGQAATTSQTSSSPKPGKKDSHGSENKKTSISSQATLV